MAEMIGLFECVSPLDFRYYGGNKRLVKEISPYFSENAKVRYQARVEAEYAKALAAKRVISKKSAESIVSAALRVKPEDVYREEERVRHDIKALVNCICANLSENEKPLVHLGLTSYDVVDTANALRFKEGTEKIILPKLKKLEKALILLALKEKNTLQIGRTHGQFAEPITFGFAIAEFVERLGERIEAIEKAKNALAGKASGAVGASNALSLLHRDPEAVESELMKRLGLKTARVSTQIVPREQMLDLEHAIVSAFGVIANLADDLRHLQRSEISEVAEAFGKEQVGSSTMPQKRNPVTFENIKSLWKEFMPRTITLYMDQISEHQRDLTNSASARFYQETFVALAVAAEKMESAVATLKVDRAKMRENFENAKGSLTAEPLYILLAKHGHPAAHETARRIALKASEKKSAVLAEAMNAVELAPFIGKFSKSEKRLLENPELYTGLATRKTAKTCAYWKKKSRL